MMVAERGEFLAKNPGKKGNGYRPGHSYGQGKKLEFRIPRDRYGNFHPQILAILRDQEEECDRLAGALYTKGLTQEQVSDVFDQIYGEHYSKSSISRMVECVRTQVNEWLERGLEEYYPVVFVDCVHIKIYCCPVKLFQTKQIRADTSHEVSALLVIFVFAKLKHNHEQR